MKRRGAAAAAAPTSLGRLRWRLTAWYVGTFFTILVLLGVGMFAVITRQFDRELDASLLVATHELAGAIQARARREGPAASDIANEVDDLRIPDRSLYLTDTLGRPLSGETTDAWITTFARDAWSHGATRASHSATDDRTLRARAESFKLDDGRALVAVAVADEIEVEDRYPSLIAAFGAAALAALVLVAAGGWFLARKSTAPIERSIVHMRRFMADAAHELRTPLTVVRSRAEVALQRERTPTEYIAALGGIERESERLGRIVEDLLMLARADAGERPIERQRVFLDDVTLDAAEAARALADRKEVRLEVGSFEEAPVNGDAGLLRQLVMILLDNAVKFTDANGRVRVSVEADSMTATLTVTDNGIGVSAEQVPHLFERFYRGDPSRTRDAHRQSALSDGVGLGLSIAQWIAEEHAGTIRIDSQAGQGTTVVVQFPRASNGDNL